VPLKEILSVIAILLTLAGFYPYVRGTLVGTTQPHVFSWVVWASTTGVVFWAQLEAGGGVGCWPIAVSAAITGLIAVLAFRRRADISITRGDWYFFVAAMSSLPLWYFTADPTWAVVVLTVVDLLGFGPTFRKVYLTPYSESLAFYAVFGVRNLIVVLAQERYAVATVLFPAAMVAGCVLLMLVLLVRRRQLGRPGE
jgi:hypothetical protein